MSISINPMMMREIIMDHYENPRNRKEINDSSYKTIHMDSASCIDNIYVQAKISNGTIVDVCWHGECCAISTASTSIMSELVKGKTIKEAENIYNNFLNMLEDKDYDENLLKEAIVFKNTGRQPSRINCATIGWRGLLKEKEN